MEQVGLTMSGVEKWLMEERSYGITGVSILLSVLVLILTGWFYMRIHPNSDIFINGHRYELEGLAKSQDNGKEIYLPVYKEKS